MAAHSVCWECMKILRVGVYLFIVDSISCCLLAFCFIGLAGDAKRYGKKRRGGARCESINASWQQSVRAFEKLIVCSFVSSFADERTRSSTPLHALNPTILTSASSSLFSIQLHHHNWLLLLLWLELVQSVVPFSAAPPLAAATCSCSLAAGC